MMSFVIFWKSILIQTSFNQPQYSNIPHIQQVPVYQPQAPQAQLYEVFIPHGYTYDPVGFYNEYMNSQIASYQNVFKVPNHAPPIFQSHEAGNVIQNQIPIQNQFPQVPLHSHQQPIVTNAINHIPQHVQYHQIGDVLQSQISIHHQSPHAPMYVHQQPIGTHEIHHIQTGVHPLIFSYQTPQSMTVTHQNIPQTHFSVHPLPVMTHSTDQMVHAYQENIPMFQSTTSTEMDLQNNPSISSSSRILSQRYILPGYEEMLDKIFEIAEVSKIIKINPMSKISLKKTKTKRETSFYVCILKNMRSRTNISIIAGVSCCKRHLKSGRNEEIFYKFCGDLAEMIHSIPEKEICILKAIFPRYYISKVSEWDVHFES